MRRLLPPFLALAIAGCSTPPPAPPPPPAPTPVFQPIPVVPQEELKIVGKFAPIGGGKHKVSIFANGERVIENTLSTKSPRGTFQGKYKGHDISADCVLTTKVDCSITIDGSPEGASTYERP